MSTLYVVGTPIGNLEDVTLRALRILMKVDFILCEDTRVTARLLNRHGITDGKLISYNEKRSGATIERIVRRLSEGQCGAIVTDAGTPGISDPGARLVEAAREAGIDVIAIPGPSALVAALSVAGVSADEFMFLGFPPHKKGRKKFFEQVATSAVTTVFYESPHRIMKALQALNELWANSPELAHSSTNAQSKRSRSKPRAIVVARELTKVHEEVLVGAPEGIIDTLLMTPEKQKGEFVVVVEPAKV